MQQHKQNRIPWKNRIITLSVFSSSVGGKPENGIFEYYKMIPNRSTKVTKTNTINCKLTKY